MNLINNYNYRHLQVIVSAWVSRVVIVLVQLVSVKVMMDSLGLENYTIFVLLTGLVGWFVLTDIGIGVSLQNYISELRAKNLPYNNMINAGAMLAVIFMCLTILALHICSPYASKLLLKNFSGLGDEEKTTLFFMNGVLSIGTCTGSIIYKIWYAESKGHLSNIAPAFASIVGLGGLILVTQYSTEKNLLLCLTVFIAPTAILPLFALLYRFFSYRKKYSEVDFPLFALIIKRGFHFWLFGVIGAGVLQVDYFIMSQLLVANDIVTYNLSTKIFGFAFFAYSSTLVALWPSFSESIAIGNWKIVLRYLKTYVPYGLIFMFTCTMILILIMQELIEILAPKETIAIPLGFILLIGFYQMIRVWTDFFTTILSSVSDLKLFYVYVPIQAIINIVVQWTLAPIIGIYGILAGIIISFLFTAVWILPMRVRYLYINRKEI